MLTLARARARGSSDDSVISKIHEVVCLSTETVPVSFLLIVADMESKAASFKEIYSEMNVLDLSLFDEGGNLTQSRVRKVLEMLGVKNLYPADIIKHHILPQFKMVS